MLGQAERIIELKSLFNKENSLYQVEKNLQPPPTLSFISGKGGTGKTFLSLNISVELSKMNKKILYADLDFNMANAHLMMNVNPVRTLSDYFSNRILFDDLVFHFTENLDIIFGDSGRTGIPDQDGDTIENFLLKIRNLKEYDAVILDLAAGAGENIFRPLKHSDFSVMIATPEPTSVMDAYALSKLMLFHNLDVHQLVLFNKIKSIEEGETAFNSLNAASQHFLKHEPELLGYISYGDEAYKSICSQKLAAFEFENSVLSDQIRKAAAKIGNILQMANIHQ